MACGHFAEVHTVRPVANSIYLPFQSLPAVDLIKN